LFKNTDIFDAKKPEAVPYPDKFSCVNPVSSGNPDADGNNQSGGIAVTPISKVTPIVFLLDDTIKKKIVFGSAGYSKKMFAAGSKYFLLYISESFIFVGTF